MKKKTRNAIDKLFGKPWFSAVGAPAAGVDSVNSWKQAQDACLSAVWTNTRLEASNLLREAIFASRPDNPRRLNCWNDIVDELELVMRPLIDAKFAPITAMESLSEEVALSTLYVVEGYGLELEYADMVPQGFYTDTVRWFMMGHFPCGWRGEYPDGNLVIY